MYVLDISKNKQKTQDTFMYIGIVISVIEWLRSYVSTSKLEGCSVQKLAHLEPVMITCLSMLLNIFLSINVTYLLIHLSIIYYHLLIY